MSEQPQEQNQEQTQDVALLLEGNVKAVCQTLQKQDEATLIALAEIEDHGQKRKGVLDAIEKLLNPKQKDDETTRTAKVVQAELEAAEDGPTDIENANRIHALRDELEALESK